MSIHLIQNCLRKVLLLGALPLFYTNIFAGQIDIQGPPGSASFGGSVIVSGNGNFIVVDSMYSIPGGAANVGAVYLYSPTGDLISTLTGSAAGDQVGSGGIAYLFPGNGVTNYAVKSPKWSNAGAANAGAVTFFPPDKGVNGVVSPSNSLVGSTAGDAIGTFVNTLTNSTSSVGVVISLNWSNGTAANAGAVTIFDLVAGTTGPVTPANSLVGTHANDQVGSGSVYLLDSNAVVVGTPNWTNGVAANAGAVTWVSGINGLKGTVVSTANSLYGSTSGDAVGTFGIKVLSNGNYVVTSSFWSNGAMTSAGAITWGNGTTGVFGPVSASNSIVGGSTNDSIGITLGAAATIVDLKNGNFVVASPFWSNNRGAVTWGNGTTGTTGVVSAANSIVGSTPNPGNSNFDFGDLVGEGNFIVLKNHNYVVGSIYWHNGAAFNAGAATWCNGATGTTGVVSASNSLVAANQNSQIGYQGNGIVALPNGNYVVSSPNWCAGFNSYEGAVTLCNGTTGTSGTISSSNSLVGSTLSDNIGSGIIALPTSDYLVSSPGWTNGSASVAGALTLCSGTTPTTGFITAANSLVGTHSGDEVSGFGSLNGGAPGSGYTPTVISLANNKFLIRSQDWTNGSAAKAGALTYYDPTAPLTGPVTTANSLVGSSANDLIGSGGIVQLSNGNVLIASPNWTNAGAANAGAVTFSPNGTAVGPVSALNSLVGSAAGDMVGSSQTFALKSGNYLVRSPNWANAGAAKAGAVTWCNGTTGQVGPVSTANSLFGNTANDQVGAGISLFSSPNLVIASPNWSHGGITGVGAVTWYDASVALIGPVSPQNSLIGKSTNDNFGSGFIQMYNDNFYFQSSSVANGPLVNAGAVTLGKGHLVSIGTFDATNTVQGTVANSGSTMNFNYDYTRNQIVVGRPASNIVTIFGDKIGPPPTIASGPTAVPNPALVGQFVGFSATAAGGVGTLTYSWNFGDGSPAGAGASVMHAYSAAGSFTATVTITDTTHPAITGSVLVQVSAGCAGSGIALVGKGPDSDCDGFSDAFETALSFTPSDPNSNPIGRPITSADILKLTITKASIKLNFKKPNKDSIQFMGTLAVPASFVAKGSIVYFDVDGVAKKLTLTAKNAAKTGNDSMKIGIKSKKHVVSMQTAKFNVAFKSGGFAATLADALPNTTTKSTHVRVVITVIFNQQIYQKVEPLNYKAKKGASGSAQSIKGQ